MSAELDPRVARGMQTLLAAWRARLEAGERRLGWKLAFGSLEGKERLGISAPLVGFMTEDALLEDGATCSVAGWENPVFECEVAVRMSRGVEPGAGPAVAAEAIGALAPAIEVVELSPPPAHVEQVLASNIYHRHVVLGPTTAVDSLEGVACRVLVEDVEVSRTAEPEELTGDTPALLAHVADVLGAMGERLSAGDVVITGAVVPPMPVPAGERVTFRIDPLGAVESTFVA